MAQPRAIIAGTVCKRVIKIRHALITFDNRLQGWIAEEVVERGWRVGSIVITSKIVRTNPHMNGTLTIETQNTIYEVVK